MASAPSPSHTAHHPHAAPTDHSQPTHYNPTVQPPRPDRGNCASPPLSEFGRCAFRPVQAYRLKLSGQSGGRSTGPSGGPIHEFENDVVLIGGPGLSILIDGKYHDALPDSAILFWRADGSPNSDWVGRIKGRTFASNMWGVGHNPNYAEDDRAVMAMSGRSGLLDRYITEKPRTSDHPDVYLVELLFEVGDTIILKGRIEEGRIVPLF